MLTLLQIVAYLIFIVRWVVIAQVILSLLISFNVVNTYNDFVGSLWRALTALTEPMYRPIRRILPDTGGIDFSPAVVLIILVIIGEIVLPSLAESLVAAPAM